MVEVEEVEEAVREDRRARGAGALACTRSFEAFVKLNKRIPPEMLMQVASIDDPARLADTIVAHLSLKLNDKQALLETESRRQAAGEALRADAGRD